MNEKPKALHLADCLQMSAVITSTGSSSLVLEANQKRSRAAADELRRLHAANAELMAALLRIIEQHGQWNNGIWAANIARAAISKTTSHDAA